MPGLLKTTFPQERPSTLQGSCRNDQLGLKFEEDWVSGIISVTFCYLAGGTSEGDKREQKWGWAWGSVTMCVTHSMVNLESFYLTTCLSSLSPGL